MHRSRSPPDAERRERRRDPLAHRPGRVGKIGGEAPDPVRAEIALGGEREGLVRMRPGVGFAAEAAGFLVAEPDHADRPAMAAAGHDLPGGGGGYRDARAIVDRAGAQIPAVEVTADHDHSGGGVGAGHFGDDVARCADADLVVVEVEMQHHRLAELDHTLEVLGVGNR